MHLKNLHTYKVLYQRQMNRLVQNMPEQNRNPNKPNNKWPLVICHAGNCSFSHAITRSRSMKHWNRLYKTLIQKDLAFLVWISSKQRLVKPISV